MKIIKVIFGKIMTILKINKTYIMSKNLKYQNSNKIIIKITINKTIVMKKTRTILNLAI